MFALLAACTRPEVAFSLEEPATLPYGGAVRGARALRVEAGAPVRVALSIEERTVVFSAWSADQLLPVLGLPLGQDTEVLATAFHRSGASSSRRFTVEADGFPDEWPEIDVLAFEPDRVAPGWILADLKASDEAVHLVALDPELRPVFAFTDVYDLQDTDLVGDGTLLTRTDANAWQLDLLGNVIAQWGYEDLHPTWIPTDTAEFHHEVVPLGPVFATMSSRILDVPAYPVSVEEPDVLGGPAQIRDPSLVVIDRATGAVVHEWFAADALDPTRIGFDAVDPREEVQDWGHGNAVAVDADGGWLVSLRHQDVVYRLDADGNLSWILGDPAGWGEAWQPYLLAPIGDLAWPYHPHGVRVDPATGDVQIFDNGNHGHTPYTPDPPGEPFSRAVGYRVDPVARTVAQVWSYDQTSTGRLFSAGMGNGWVQENGNVLADFATVDAEEGVTNTARGWGEKTARWVEWAPDAPDAPVFDVRIRSDGPGHGWTSYRVQKVPGLYPSSGPWAVQPAGSR